MEHRDIQQALTLINREGWNYSSEEIERMLRLDPSGSFFFDDGPSQAVVTCVSYSHTGVIGHLVVSKPARGQRIGRAMLQRAIDYLEGQGVDSIILYATEEGARLYDKFGFKSIRRAHCTFANTFQKTGLRVSMMCELVKPRDTAEIIEIDRKIFGDDRTKVMKMLLSEFPQHSFKLERNGRIIGFSLGRATPQGFDLGPWNCLTGSIVEAESLLYATMSSFGPGTMFLGIFADNLQAMKIAGGLSKIKTWQTTLMIRGKDRYSSHIENVFGVAAFELG